MIALPIVLSHTVISHRAVVIHDHDTTVAQPTVLCSDWLNATAGVTEATQTPFKNPNGATQSLNL